MKTFECRRAGVVCDAKLYAETDDELLRKVVDHAKKKHGVDVAESQTLVRYARSLIRTEG